MKIDIINEVPRLIDAGIITEEDGMKIIHYYQTKEKVKIHPLLLIFGILGSVFSGLGLILIIGHNWDYFSVLTKTLIAFTPLLLSQIMCGYVLLKRSTNKIWKEATATLLFFTVGACIAQISQIYHIVGDMSTFLLIWTLLAVPLVYIMSSYMVSLLTIVLVTAYGMSHMSSVSPHEINYVYWALILTMLPNYILLVKENKDVGFITLHHWILPLSIAIMFLTFTDKDSSPRYTIVYMSLMGLYYLMGNLLYAEKIQFFRTGYKPISVAISLIVIFYMSSIFAWNEMDLYKPFIFSRDFNISLILTAISTYLFLDQFKNTQLKNINPFNFLYLIYFIFICIGLYTPFGFILINTLILVLGIGCIYQGMERTHVKLMNLGLLIVSIWVLIKFFSSDYSFLLRGIVFIVMGIGFYIANYQIINKRKINE